MKLRIIVQCLPFGRRMRVAEKMMDDRVLLVDDEQAVLDGYKRLLHREFSVDTAVSGEAALASIRAKGPYSVIISDMRMPGMNGAQLLAEIQRTVPHTVRMLLTGYSDISDAIDAVNKGQIFRFLTKPCEKDDLVAAINAGIEQYRLILAERQLLEKTLMGSIKALTEILSAASPEAFGRSQQIARYVRHLTAKLKIPSPWRFEAAAMLSQLGCVALDPALVKASYRGGRLLSAENQARFSKHPQLARDLLAHIPRLEQVAWMIGQQLRTGEEYKGHDAGAISLGAKILRLAVAFDNQRNQGLSRETAIQRLRAHRGEFDLDLIECLADVELGAGAMEPRTLPIRKLTTGMILQQDISTNSGMLFIPGGQEITQALLMKLQNLAQAGSIPIQISVLAPKESE